MNALYWNDSTGQEYLNMGEERSVILTAQTRPRSRPVTLCSVFRSGKKAETYLYLAQGHAWEDLPAELRLAFGEPVFVMRLKLDEGRSLARVDTRQVLEQLDSQGFFLQLPPEIGVEEEITRRFSDA